jgi:glycosyltransferase involved in cell wall biosynthesis
VSLPRVLLVNDHPARGGIGRYTRELDRALCALAPPEFEVDLLLQNMPGRIDPADWRVDAPSASPVFVQPRPPWAKSTGFGPTYLLNSYLYFPARTPRGYDLYHFSSQMMGAGVRYAAPAVVTVQDLIALRLSTNHPGLSTWLRRRHFTPLRRARGLIFASEYSRRDYLSLFDFPEERTSVVHHAVSPVFTPQDRQLSRAALGLDPNRPILLHVGSEERRKNVETLLAALARLVEQRPDLLLLRVGARSSRSRGLIARLGLEHNVRYRSALTEPQLAACYSAADLFVFPSYFEGFGFPVLEAMSSGCPVVAARATSVPEITGTAAVLFDPMDVDALSKIVEGLLADRILRDDLRRRGLERAAGFTWARAARQTADAYHRALGTA